MKPACREGIFDHGSLLPYCRLQVEHVLICAAMHIPFWPQTVLVFCSVV